VRRKSRAGLFPYSVQTYTAHISGGRPVQLIPGLPFGCELRKREYHQGKGVGKTGAVKEVPGEPANEKGQERARIAQD
jgi:hypothetical protein